MGTLETLKHMPGYEEAISKLKEQAAEEQVEDKKLEL